jgi:hypothetical protein
MNRNPILQLKEQEEITIGGVGGRAARDVKALLAPLPSSIMDLKPLPVSQARQEMARSARESIINGLTSGAPLTGFAHKVTMNPDFQDAIVHELQFGKVERHPRKAMRSYKRASKAMVRGFLKEVKHHG